MSQIIDKFGMISVIACILGVINIISIIMAAVQYFMSDSKIAKAEKRVRHYDRLLRKLNRHEDADPDQVFDTNENLQEAMGVYEGLMKKKTDYINQIRGSAIICGVAVAVVILMPKIAKKDVSSTESVHGEQETVQEDIQSNDVEDFEIDDIQSEVVEEAAETSEQFDDVSDDTQDAESPILYEEVTIRKELMNDIVQMDALLTSINEQRDLLDRLGVNVNLLYMPEYISGDRFDYVDPYTIVMLKPGYISDNGYFEYLQDDDYEEGMDPVQYVKDKGLRPFDIRYTPTFINNGYVNFDWYDYSLSFGDSFLSMFDTNGDVQMFLINSESSQRNPVDFGVLNDNINNSVYMKDGRSYREVYLQDAQLGNKIRDYGIFPYQNLIESYRTIRGKYFNTLFAYLRFEAKQKGYIK